MIGLWNFKVDIAPHQPCAFISFNFSCFSSGKVVLMWPCSLCIAVILKPLPECFDGEATDHLVDGGLRVVLMVIDACRLSFLTDVDSPMTFLRRSIMSGRAVAFMANSQTPTVTMPRIKVSVDCTFHRAMLS